MEASQRVSTAVSAFGRMSVRSNRRHDHAGRFVIPRRGIQFLDLGDDERNRQLVQLTHGITRAFARSSMDDAAIRLYRGEQRAIGELMISTDRVRQPHTGWIPRMRFA